MSMTTRLPCKGQVWESAKGYPGLREAKQMRLSPESSDTGHSYWTPKYRPTGFASLPTTSTTVGLLLILATVFSEGVNYGNNNFHYLEKTVTVIMLLQRSAFPQGYGFRQPPHGLQGQHHKEAQMVALAPGVLSPYKPPWSGHATFLLTLGHVACEGSLLRWWWHEQSVLVEILKDIHLGTLD